MQLQGVPDNEGRLAAGRKSMLLQRHHLERLSRYFQTLRRGMEQKRNLSIVELPLKVLGVALVHIL